MIDIFFPIVTGTKVGRYNEDKIKSYYTRQWKAFFSDGTGQTPHD